MTGARQSSPLIGRHREYSRLESAWLAARSGRGSICWLTSVAGGGSTRLIEELEHRGVQDGALVLSVDCAQTADTPYATIRSAGENFMRLVRSMEAERAAECQAHIEEASREHMPVLAKLTSNVAELPDVAGRFVAEDVGSPTRFAESIAVFLSNLATARWPVMFVLDEIQHIDQASAQALRRLGEQVDNRHILVVCAAEEAPDVDSRPEAIFQAVEHLALSQLRLAPLDEAAVAEMIVSELGKEGLDPGVVRQIAARTHGIPLAIREYIFAMLEAGLLRPVRDGWRIDTSGLASLDLPEDLTDLMLRRLDDLDDGAREILGAAAVEGQRFCLSLLYEYGGAGRSSAGEEATGEEATGEEATSDEAISDAISQAVHLRLVELTAGDTYAFVHQRIRQALLDGLDDERRRLIHQRIADVLDASDDHGQEHLFALARHYTHGQVESHRDRVYATNLQAGLVALRRNAFEEAYGFLTTATRWAPPEAAEDGRLARATGEACAATGRVAEALAQFEAATAVAQGPLERARLRARLARVWMASLEMDEAWQQIRQALEEIDSSPPRPGAASGLSPVSGLSAIFAWLWAWLVARVPTRASNATEGAAAPRLRLRAHLYEVGAITAFFRLDDDLMGALIIRALHIARRLPDCAEKARVYATYAAVLSILGRQRGARAYASSAREMAEALDDRAVLARARWFEATTHEFLGEAARAETLLRRTLEDSGLWLELWEHVIVCGELGGLLLDRGYVGGAARWGRRILDRTRLSPNHDDFIHMERVYGLYLIACKEAWSGKGIQARAYVERAKRLLEGRTDIGLGEASAVGYELAVHYELGNRGEAVEELLDRWAQFELSPARLPHQVRRFYVYQAYLRLDQWRWARDFDKNAAHRRFIEALDELELAADTPKYLTHYFVICADRAALQDDWQNVGALLNRASELADAADSPWGLFEVELRRARMLDREGAHQATSRHARWAHDIAREHGWEHRARDVRTEFRVYLDSPASATSARVSTGHSASGSAGSTNAQSLKLERYLDALLEVAIASGTVFDSQQQARVALDEIVRIFGAERAFLFTLGETDKETLTMVAGRDVRGRDLDDFGDYSLSVVERVARERKAVVSTGSDEGKVLASSSAVHHNLRSIMAGPVQIQDRFLGVVYVDSRLARGVFARDDAEILMAISSHIGIAQETARAARLEVDVESERKKRELAEVIRKTTTAMSATFDQSEVLGRLLEGVTEVVDVDRAVAFLLGAEGVTSFAEKTNEGATAGRGSDWVLDDPRIERVLDSARPQISGGARGQGDEISESDADQSWLTVPIVARGDLAGTMLLERDQPDAYGRDHVELALALAGQAGIAVENARLFAQVQRLAVVDELTQLPNRRRLFEVADKEFQRARRYGETLSVIMLDIDHFKAVNDAHGHAVGDVILREVANRCAKTLRQTDTIGRYGGEEFVVVMPQTPLEEASGYVAERLRDAVAATPVDTDAGPVEITISLGVAELASFDKSLDDLLNRADQALYDAKDAGRNRVETA
ncbi:MAG: diguanylate cyclase [Persicimonas sp.]